MLHNPELRWKDLGNNVVEVEADNADSVTRVRLYFNMVTNAGGPGILLADAWEAHGLVLPELVPETHVALRAFLPAQAGLGNPVDMIASATPEHYARSLEVVGADANIDTILLGGEGHQCRYRPQNRYGRSHYGIGFCGRGGGGGRDLHRAPAQSRRAPRGDIAATSNLSWP
jgi:hypothetical protein